MLECSGVSHLEDILYTSIEVLKVLNFEFLIEEPPLTCARVNSGGQVLKFNPDSRDFRCASAAPTPMG